MAAGKVEDHIWADDYRTRIDAESEDDSLALIITQLHPDVEVTLRVDDVNVRRLRLALQRHERYRREVTR